VLAKRNALNAPAMVRYASLTHSTKFLQLIKDRYIYSNGQQIKARSVVTIRKSNTKGDEATRQIDTHPKLKALLENHVSGDRHVFPGRHRHNGSINPRACHQLVKLELAKLVTAIPNSGYDATTIMCSSELLVIKERSPSCTT